MTIPVKKKGNEFSFNERIVESMFVHRYLDFSKNHLILEVGPGASWLLFELATFGHKVVGVDPYPYPYKHPNLTFYKMNAEDFKYKDKFDYVISVSVLEHINDSKKLQNIIDNIYYHLKPKGRFIVTVPIGRKERRITKVSHIDVFEYDEWISYCKEFKLIHEEFYIRRSNTLWEKTTKDRMIESRLLIDVRYISGTNSVGCFCFQKEVEIIVSNISN